MLACVSKGTGKKVSSWEFSDDAVGNMFNMKTGKERLKTKSTCSYTLDGEKKVRKSFIHHLFCPFCGKKY
jgi:hypothetical protein